MSTDIRPSSLSLQRVNERLEREKNPVRMRRKTRDLGRSLQRRTSRQIHTSAKHCAPHKVWHLSQLHHLGELWRCPPEALHRTAASLILLTATADSIGLSVPPFCPQFISPNQRGPWVALLQSFQKNDSLGRPLDDV